MARAAQDGGAVARARARRRESAGRSRERVAIPIIGLIKREYPGFRTVHHADARGGARRLLATGAEIVAVRCDRFAPAPAVATVRDAIVAAIHAARRARDGRLRDRRRRDGGAGRRRRHRRDDALRLHRANRRARAAGARSRCASSRELRCVRRLRGRRSPRRRECARHSRPGPMPWSSERAITNVDWLVREFAGSADRRLKPVKSVRAECEASIVL